MSSVYVFCKCRERSTGFLGCQFRIVQVMVCGEHYELPLRAKYLHIYFEAGETLKFWYNPTSGVNRLIQEGELEISP